MTEVKNMLDSNFKGYLFQTPFPFIYKEVCSIPLLFCV